MIVIPDLTSSLIDGSVKMYIDNSFAKSTVQFIMLKKKQTIQVANDGYVNAETLKNEDVNVLLSREIQKLSNDCDQCQIGDFCFQ